MCLKSLRSLSILFRITGSLSTSCYSLEILNRLSFKIVSSERIRLPVFSINYLSQCQKMFDSLFLIKVSNWDLNGRLIN